MQDEVKQSGGEEKVAVRKKSVSELDIILQKADRYTNFLITRHMQGKENARKALKSGKKSVTKRQQSAELEE